MDNGKNVCDNNFKNNFSYFKGYTILNKVLYVFLKNKGDLNLFILDENNKVITTLFNNIYYPKVYTYIYSVNLENHQLNAVNFILTKNKYSIDSIVSLDDCDYVGYLLVGSNNNDGQPTEITSDTLDVEQTGYEATVEVKEQETTSAITEEDGLFDVKIDNQTIIKDAITGELHSIPAGDGQPTEITSDTLDVEQTGYEATVEVKEQETTSAITEEDGLFDVKIDNQTIIKDAITGELHSIPAGDGQPTEITSDTLDVEQTDYEATVEIKEQETTSAITEEDGLFDVKIDNQTIIKDAITGELQAPKDEIDINDFIAPGDYINLSEELDAQNQPTGKTKINVSSEFFCFPYEYSIDNSIKSLNDQIEGLYCSMSVNTLINSPEWLPPDSIWDKIMSLQVDETKRVFIGTDPVTGAGNRLFGLYLDRGNGFNRRVSLALYASYRINGDMSTAITFYPNDDKVYFSNGYTTDPNTTGRGFIRHYTYQQLEHQLNDIIGMGFTDEELEYLYNLIINAYYYEPLDPNHPLLDNKRLLYYDQLMSTALEDEDSNPILDKGETGYLQVIREDDGKYGGKLQKSSNIPDGGQPTEITSESLDVEQTDYEATIEVKEQAATSAITEEDGLFDVKLDPNSFIVKDNNGNLVLDPNRLNITNSYNYSGTGSSSFPFTIELLNDIGGLVSINESNMNNPNPIIGQDIALKYQTYSGSSIFAIARKVSSTSTNNYEIISRIHPKTLFPVPNLPSGAARITFSKNIGDSQTISFTSIRDNFLYQRNTIPVLNTELVDQDGTIARITGGYDSNLTVTTISISSDEIDINDFIAPGDYINLSPELDNQNQPTGKTKINVITDEFCFPYEYSADNSFEILNDNIYGKKDDFQTIVNLDYDWDNLLSNPPSGFVDRFRKPSGVSYQVVYYASENHYLEYLLYLHTSTSVEITVRSTFSESSNGIRCLVYSDQPYDFYPTQKKLDIPNITLPDKFTYEKLMTWATDLYTNGLISQEPTPHDIEFIAHIFINALYFSNSKVKSRKLYFNTFLSSSHPELNLSLSGSKTLALQRDDIGNLTSELIESYHPYEYYVSTDDTVITLRDIYDGDTIYDLGSNSCSLMIYQDDVALKEWCDINITDDVISWAQDKYAPKMVHIFAPHVNNVSCPTSILGPLQMFIHQTGLNSNHLRIYIMLNGYGYSFGYNYSTKEIQPNVSYIQSSMSPYKGIFPDLDSLDFNTTEDSTTCGPIYVLNNGITAPFSDAVIEFFKKLMELIRVHPLNTDTYYSLNYDVLMKKALEKNNIHKLNFRNSGYLKIKRLGMGKYEGDLEVYDPNKYLYPYIYTNNNSYQLWNADLIGKTNFSVYPNYKVFEYTPPENFLGRLGIDEYQRYKEITIYDASVDWTWYSIGYIYVNHNFFGIENHGSDGHRNNDMNVIIYDWGDGETFEPEGNAEGEASINYENIKIPNIPFNTIKDFIDNDDNFPNREDDIDDIIQWVYDICTMAFYYKLNEVENKTYKLTFEELIDTGHPEDNLLIGETSLMGLHKDEEGKLSGKLVGEEEILTPYTYTATNSSYAMRRDTTPPGSNYWVPQQSTQPNYHIISNNDINIDSYLSTSGIKQGLKDYFDNINSGFNIEMSAMWKNNTGNADNSRMKVFVNIIKYSNNNLLLTIQHKNLVINDEVSIVCELNNFNSTDVADISFKLIQASIGKLSVWDPNKTNLADIIVPNYLSSIGIDEQNYPLINEDIKNLIDAVYGEAFIYYVGNETIEKLRFDSFIRDTEEYNKLPTNATKLLGLHKDQEGILSGKLIEELDYCKPYVYTTDDSWQVYDDDLAGHEAPFEILYNTDYNWTEYANRAPAGLWERMKSYIYTVPVEWIDETVNNEYYEYYIESRWGDGCTLAVEYRNSNGRSTFTLNIMSSSVFIDKYLDEEHLSFPAGSISIPTITLDSLKTWLSGITDEDADYLMEFYINAFYFKTTDTKSEKLYFTQLCADFEDLQPGDSGTLKVKRNNDGKLEFYIE